MSPTDTTTALHSGTNTGQGGVPSAGALPRQGLGVVTWVACCFLGLVVLLAVCGPLLPFLQDPLEPTVDYRQAPSAAHWFGTDGIGRDLFARCVLGARVSLMIGLISVAVATVVGTAVGVVGGYYQRWIDRGVSGVIDVMLAFPPLVLALALVAFLGPSLRNLILVLAILSIPAVARIARAGTIAVSQREFVVAARGLGARGRRIIVTELLPNVVPVVLAYAMVQVAVIIVAEGSLSFLGLGVPPPTPTWGSIINEGRNALASAPHISLLPAAVMFVTVLSFNLLGDRLRSRFETRGSRL